MDELAKGQEDADPEVLQPFLTWSDFGLDDSQRLSVGEALEESSQQDTVLGASSSPWVRRAMGRPFSEGIDYVDSEIDGSESDIEAD